MHFGTPYCTIYNLQCTLHILRTLHTATFSLDTTYKSVCPRTPNIQWWVNDTELINMLMSQCRVSVYTVHISRILTTAHWTLQRCRFECRIARTPKVRDQEKDRKDKKEDRSSSCASSTDGRHLTELLQQELHATSPPTKPVQLIMLLPPRVNAKMWKREIIFFFGNVDWYTTSGLHLINHVVCLCSAKMWWLWDFVYQILRWNWG